MSAGNYRPRTKNSRGRPLADQTIAIRAAIAELPAKQRVMTVRGIFYALTVLGVVPKDETRGYRPVQRQVLQMRRDGVLPWGFVADGTRVMRKPETWNDVDDALTATWRTYRRNLWRSQGVRCEVWLEKDALAGIVVEATERWDVPLMVSKGTSSATFLHSAAMQAVDAWHEGIETRIFTLYDFDAAGERAARNVGEGLREFAPDVPITVERLAVSREQIAMWNLPTRPAKATDPEAAKFGSDAVELDAIPPSLLINLVEDAIVTLVDENAWRMEQLVEQDERDFLERLVGVS